MRAVGYRGPDLFNSNVVKRIAQGSAGLTRRINLIADKALLAAFSENTHTIEPRHVAAALRDSEFARDGIAAASGRKRWVAIAAGLGLTMILIAAAWYLLGPGNRVFRSMEHPPTTSPPASEDLVTFWAVSWGYAGLPVCGLSRPKFPAGR